MAMCVRRREVDLPVTTSVAYTRVMAALAARGATAEPMWPPGTIRALGSMSLLSWGEGITVWLAPAPCGMRVYIESRPRQPTVVDWGRNQRNVDRIAAMITADPPRPVDVSMPQDRPA